MSKSFAYFGVFVLIILSYLIGSIHYVQQDSESYLQALQILQGDNISDRLMRLIKPIPLVIPYLLHQIGLSTISAFIIQSILCVLLSVYFIRGILFHHNPELKQKTTHLIMALLIMLGCQCTSVYGIAVLTDSFSWAIILGLFYYMLRLESIQPKHIIHVGLVIGLGFFVKESTLLVLIFTMIYVMMQKSTLIARIKPIIWISSMAFFIIVSISLWQDISLGYSFYDWFTYNKTDSPKIYWVNTLKQLFRTLDFFWLLLIYIVILQFNSIRTDRFSLALILTSFICIVTLPFIWDYHFDRIQFVGVLPLLPILGIYGRSIRMNGLLFSIIGILNLTNTYLIYRFQYSLLYIGIISVSMLLLGHYHLIHKKSPN